MVNKNEIEKMYYKVFRKILITHFKDENPFKNDEICKRKYSNKYQCVETYPASVIKYYVDRLIDNGMNDKEISNIIDSKISNDSVFPYVKSSNVDDLMRRYRLLLTLFGYNIAFYARNDSVFKNMTSEKDIKDYIYKLSNYRLYSRLFVNNNHVYCHGYDEMQNKSLESIIPKKKLFVCNRIGAIMDINCAECYKDPSYMDGYYDERMNRCHKTVNKLIFITDTIYKYYVNENPITFKDMSDDDKKEIIASIIYLCTNDNDINFYKKPNNLLKKITTSKNIDYNDSNTWNILSTYIEKHMSGAFKVWLDCNPYTHPCADSKNYFFVQAMEFMYVMSTDRSPHSNRFRLEKFILRTNG